VLLKHILVPRHNKIHDGDVASIPAGADSARQLRCSSIASGLSSALASMTLMAAHCKSGFAGPA